ncbi:MAG: hypothetical protein KGH57_00360 [Candidatus Micrarchaeota archaeon]|nr:hypothetical protein [Candidatus Micrarchaeota archaeon]
MDAINDYWYVDRHDQELDAIKAGRSPISWDNRKEMERHVREDFGRAFVDEAILTAVQAHNRAAALAFLDSDYCRSLVTYGAAKVALGLLSDSEPKGSLDSLAGSLLERELQSIMDLTSGEVKEKGALEVFRKRKGMQEDREHVAATSYISNLAYGLLECAVDMQSANDVRELLAQKEEFLDYVSAEDMKRLGSSSSPKSPEIRETVILLSKHFGRSREADEAIDDAVGSIRDALRTSDPEYVAVQLKIRTGLDLSRPPGRQPIRVKR